MAITSQVLSFDKTEVNNSKLTKHQYEHCVERNDPEDVF